MRKYLLTMVALGVIVTGAFAQRTCGTMDYLAEQIQQDPSIIQNMQQIDQFTQDWMANNDGSERIAVTIPVVVHVVYNTSAQNISDSRIQAQIAQLNLDFAHTNSDAGNVPSYWQSITGNTEIQFCLAARDPNGNATNGIERRSTTVTSFSMNNNIKHYANGGLDAWPAGSYLNIWVGNLSGGLLGYAQFPGGSSSNDGVVVLYSTVGSMTNPGTASPYDLGRTATHEVGHWLNLYHIWGDDGTGCTGSDQVSDTPNQADETYGCFSPGTIRISCSNSPNGDMWQNYMDYTDDACMYMFTLGQKSRMQALFGTGGSRVSLLTSLGCTPPSGGTCSTPAGMNTTGITSSGATFNWSAVGSATSYNVRYKPTSSGTWTNTTSTSTSKSVTGLTANTAHEWQVQAVCGSTSSAYSGSTNFTTSASGGTCTNNYEPNNSKNSAVTIPVNSAINSMIGSSNDNDWFKFQNTTSQKNMKITLSTLPFDYDLKFYNTSGQLVATSEFGGTTNETIIWNTNTVGTYKARVYGWNGAFSTTQCYTLLVETSATAFRLEEGDVVNASMKNGTITSIYPNPTAGMLAMEYFSIATSDLTMQVFDMVGKEVFTQQQYAYEGSNTYYLNMNQLAPGMYVCSVNDGSHTSFMKFMIQR